MSIEKLHILIRSFSFKKSTLEGVGEHGMGFVFDMRAIDNPGRREDMKHMSGLDSEVKTFLENKTEMPRFLDHVHALTELTVQRFLEREFSQLVINFGCTGGQHRSVYAAEEVARYLGSKYPVLIQVEHLEKDNWNK